MTDYIKREDAVRAVIDAKTGKDKTIDGTRQVTDCLRRIKDIPSADVVKVTRCEDCIHYDNCAKEIDEVNNGEVHITRIMEWCSHGEREEA